MNIHHLELFYYVAKFGGISEAVRRIPYGIQQPAVSGQIIQLEEFLGTSLFQRRPFALTAAGAELFEYIAPFFGNLDAISQKLRGGMAQCIRIGASEVILRDHLPVVIQEVRKKFPQLRVSLKEGYQPDLESWVQKQEIDLAVTLLEKRSSSRIHRLPLLSVPLILLVPKAHALKSAEALWKSDRIQESLICLPPNEAICKNFQQGLRSLGIDWFPGIEVSSLDLIQAFVANGFGIGLSVAAPGSKLPSTLRALPLEGFSPVTLGVIWQGKTTPLMETLLEAMKHRVESLLRLKSAKPTDLS